MIKNQARLFRRNHTYYIRVSIPNDLKNIIKNKEIKYSFDYFESLKLLRQESAKIDIVLDEIRAGRVERMDFTNKGKLFLNDNEIQLILSKRVCEADDYFTENYIKLNKGRIPASDVSIFKDINDSNLENIVSDLYEFNDEKQEVSEEFTELNRKSKEIARNYVLKFLKNYENNSFISDKTKLGIEKLEKNDISISSWWFYHKFYKKLLALENSFLKKAACIRSGYKYEEYNPAVEQITKTAHSENNNFKESISVKTKWYELYEKANQIKLEKGEISVRTKKEGFVNVSVMFDLVQKENIEDITYKDCRYISANLHKLPANYSKKKQFKGLNVREVIVANEKYKFPTISKATLSKYFISFLGLMKSAHKERLIIEDFSSAFDFPKKNGKKYKNSIDRFPFSGDDLRKIFNSETYSMGIDARSAARYWIPLIALFTGCRLNEICQLYLSDIRCDNGQYYFDINDDAEDKSLKTVSSRRKIPIHHRLIELGFLSFYNAVVADKNARKYMKKSKSRKKIPFDSIRRERLFYVLDYVEGYGYTNAIGKWFARYLTAVGIVEKEKVFHCFRHTMENALANKNVDTTVQDFIGGWERAGTGQSEYLKSIGLPLMAGAINKVDFPMVDFSSLKKEW